MFFRKGYSGGFFKKATDVGQIGIKALAHPVTHTALNIIDPNSTVAKVSSLLQKHK